MRMMCLALVALTLTACAAPAPPAPPPQNADQASADDTCGMARFAHWIGRPATEIDRASLPPRTRVITPDMMVTQDFSAERLNILVGADGIVGSMRCF